MNGEAPEIPQPEDIKREVGQGRIKKDPRDGSAEKKPKAKDREKIDERNRDLVEEVGERLKENVAEFLKKGRRGAWETMGKGMN
jgi:hypothetical protein